MRACILAILSFLMLPTFAAPLLSNLTITQGVKAGEFSYTAAPEVGIGFTLAQAANVTVTVRRHLPAWRQFQGAYLVDPVPVRTLALGRLAEGAHRVAWDGLDAAGKPVTVRENVPNTEVRKLDKPTAAQLTRDVPVDLFQIDVTAGKETMACNFQRTAGAVDASRRVTPFIGAVRDAAGNAIVAARLAWRGRRFTPAWRQDMTFPGTSAGHSSDPVETFDAAVDAHGTVYMATVNGVYKFAVDGSPAAWVSDADYINYPYPSTTRSVLGVRLDPNAKGKKEYVFGPGGGGGRKYWDTAATIDTPGFAFNWSGVAVDADGNVYVGRNATAHTVQVFAPSGAYLRTLPLPDGMAPRALRVGIDGALWVTSDYTLLRLNATTGAVEKRLNANGNALAVGADGAIYVYSGDAVTRFTAAGDPLPFDKTLPTVRDGGNVLHPLARDNKAPAGSAAYPSQLFGLVVNTDGSFAVSEFPATWDDTPTRLLHFAAGGRFLPDLLDVQVGKRRPGNVFLDADPATLDLYVTNLDTHPAALMVEWSLTAFAGATLKGSAEYTAAAACRQTLPLTVPADAPGQYTLTLTVKTGTQTVGAYTTQLARLPSRKIEANRFSPFAIAWGCDFPLMAYAGVKSERGDSASWATKVEPVDGLFYPDPADAITYQESNEGFRRYARQWGHYLLNGFSYGESWLGGDYPNCRIFQYDRFYGYCLGVTGRFAGKGEAFYQFWNEPNFFWHVPGPFSREQFELVTRHVWNIVKARDKDALCVPDGDAGGLGMMREFAAHGTGAYTDATLFHYPGSAPVTFDKMPVPGLPEGKLPMVEALVRLRDEKFPAKPVWNTEEGWWGGDVKTPENGARVLPRIYLTQLAAGVDKLYWFAMASADDPTYLLNIDNEPNPAYVSYATLSRFIEGTGYAGRLELGDGTYGLCFAHGKQAVVALWTLQGTRNIPLPAAMRGTVTDMMGRLSKAGATLTLTPDVQYLSVPLTAICGAAKAELVRRLAALGLKQAGEIPAALRATAPHAATDDAALTRVHHLLLAAETATYAGEAPGVPGTAGWIARQAHAAVTAREGADGYLGRARALLEWTDRLASLGLTWATIQAADAVRGVAAQETPCFPGITLNAFIGEPGEVARIRAIVPKPFDLTTTVDEKFRFEIPRKAGEMLTLELTAWNYYTHPISVTVAPRLPAGWATNGAAVPLTLAPGTYQRVTYTVTLPANVPPGLYTVGGATTYQGQRVEEIYPMRVRVE